MHFTRCGMYKLWITLQDFIGTFVHLLTGKAFKMDVTFV